MGESYSCASGNDIVAGRFGLPAWRRNLAVNAWVEIVGSAMANTPPSVDPGHNSGSVSAKMDAWCGLAIDSRSGIVWSLANGGHLDYFGNEVMKLNLAANSPAWVEVLPSDTYAAMLPMTGGYYGSGRPASAHSYYSQQFIESRDRAIRFGVEAGSPSGFGFVNVDGFNCNVGVGANGWDAAGTYPNAPSMLAGQVTTKNPTTGDVFAFNANSSVFKWTNATNAWSTVSTGFPPISPEESANAYDTARNRILLVRDSGIHHTFDPATGLFTAQTFSGTGASTIAAAAKSAGMVYEPNLDAYLFRLGQTAGGAVYSIDASTFVVTPLSTTGGAAIPTTAAISGAPENVYSRFLYVPTLGGVVYFPQYSANAWFLRTH